MVSNQVSRVLIAGCGITSSIIASRLCNVENVKTFDIAIWDKAKGAGGRMSTSRGAFENSSIDLGCQYVSCSPSAWKEHSQYTSPTQHPFFLKFFFSYYTELISAGVLEPFNSKILNFKEGNPETKHFVAPHGMSSVVKFYLDRSGCKPQFGHHINSIVKVQGQWNVSTLDGKYELFDVVILTMPVPQVLQLKGDIQAAIDSDGELKRKLEAVEYSSRFCLGLFYDKETDLKLPADVGYVNNHPVYRYFAIDNKRRNRPQYPTTLVLHSTVQFGETHKEKLPEVLEPFLIESLKMLFPDLPRPAAIKTHKWKFSQVLKPFEGAPGFVSISDNLLVGGDGFTQSNFEGCVKSAENIACYLPKY